MVGFVWGWLGCVALLGVDGYDPTVRGKVVDAAGRPVVGATVAPFLVNEAASGEDVGDLPEQARMRPGADPRATTDAAGRFAIRLDWRTRHVAALGPDGAASGVARLGVAGGADAEIRLGPPVAIRGRVADGVDGKPRRGFVFANLPADPADPSLRPRLGGCQLVGGRFAFDLPAGPYELELITEEPDAHFEPPVRFAASPDRPAVDLGTLPAAEAPYPFMVVMKRRLADPCWVGDYAKYYGQAPPPIHAVAGRGVAASAQPADFRGKWLLIYFWGLDCAPCVADTIPALIRLRREHAAQLDRFEILGVCLDFEERMTTMAEFDRQAQGAVARVWREPIPFPILLDPSMKTARNYGLDGYGRALLIDPDGKLVPGGIEALEAVLRRP